MINLLQAMTQDSVSIVSRIPVSDQVNSVINNISSKLSVPATKLFEVLAKQSYAEGIANVITATLFLAMVAIAGKIAHVSYKKGEQDKWKDGTNIGWCMAGTVGSLLLLIPTITYLRDGIMQLINPQYYAVKFILEALSPATR